jgi:hypothetical protein
MSGTDILRSDMRDMGGIMFSEEGSNVRGLEVTGSTSCCILTLLADVFEEDGHENDAILGGRRLRDESVPDRPELYPETPEKRDELESRRSFHQFGPLESTEFLRSFRLS